MQICFYKYIMQRYSFLAQKLLEIYVLFMEIPVFSQVFFYDYSLNLETEWQIHYIKISVEPSGKSKIFSGIVEAERYGSFLAL